MAYDPLSPATRKARTRTLIFASAALLIEVYDLRLTEISFSLLKVEFEETALPVSIYLGLTYFLLSFSIYVAIDYLNIPKTELETQVIKKKEAMRIEILEAIVDNVEKFFMNEDAIEFLYRKHPGDHMYLFHEIRRRCEMIKKIDPELIKEEKEELELYGNLILNEKIKMIMFPYYSTIAYDEKFVKDIEHMEYLITDKFKNILNIEEDKSFYSKIMHFDLGMKNFHFIGVELLFPLLYAITAYCIFLAGFIHGLFRTSQIFVP